jgi:acyl-CoA synthetase (AMP-forming)/AMP-acid ligase II
VLDSWSLWDLVVRRAAETPDARLAVDEHGGALTFAGFRDAAERASAGLQALGVTQGSVVSWQLPTWLESIVLTAALCRLGAVQNPILHIYREREVGFITKQAKATLLLVPSTWRGFDFQAMATRAVAASTQVVVADRQLPDGDPATLPPPPTVPTADRDAPVRWLFYTSGTTADPKGAQHTDRDLIVTAQGMCERLDFGPTDRSAILFPVTHIAGPIWLASSLAFGGSAVLQEAFDPATTPQLLSDHDVTMAGSGTVFHMAYLKAQREQPDTPLFPSLRNCPGGGAPKPPQLHYDVKKELGGAGILSGWGLTEAPILTMGAYDDPDDKLATTEGRAMPGVELISVRLDGERARAGEEGELRARAPQLMKGYLDASLDADAFDSEGFFRTGDLGVIDDDGYVVITGRLKDIIIRKGENISAKEVEDLLFAHPGVADVAVIGLPDAEVGERCCAVVVPHDASSPPTFDEVVRYLRGEGLTTYKLPERLELVEVLPRNPAGKVLKQDLRAAYAS